MIGRSGRLAAAFVVIAVVFFTWAFPVLWTAVTSLKYAKDISPILRTWLSNRQP